MKNHKSTPNERKETKLIPTTSPDKKKEIRINWNYLKAKGLLVDPATLDSVGRMRLCNDLSDVYFEMRIRGYGRYDEMKRLHELKERASEAELADYPNFKWRPAPTNWKTEIIMIRRASRGIPRDLPVFND